MEVFFGYQFHEFIKTKIAVQIDEALLGRAVKTGIIWPTGADYFRGLR